MNSIKKIVYFETTSGDVKIELKLKIRYIHKLFYFMRVAKETSLKVKFKASFVLGVVGL